MREDDAAVVDARQRLVAPSLFPTFPPLVLLIRNKRLAVMSKPSKISILASKIYAQLRESNEEYTAVELYSMQMILKEELARSWLFEVLSAADRTVVISPEQKQL